MHTDPPIPHAVPVEGAEPFGRRFALVGPAGSLVRPPELRAVGAFHADGAGGWTAPAADLAGSWGYLDHRGHWIVEPGLEHATDFDGAGLSRFREHGLWGYADATGARVIAARFTEAAPFRHGFAAVRTGEGAGYADLTGRLVTGGHQAAGAFGPNGLGAVRLADGSCGYLDRQGRSAFPTRFDGARPFNAAGTAPVRVGELWGLVDETGGWVVEPCFRLLEAYDENGLAYAVGGTPGDTFLAFVDARGERVVTRDGEMDDVLRCGLLKAGDGYGTGFRDAAGAWAIEPAYEWADRFDGAGAAVARSEDEGAWGVLRADGSFTATAHPEPLTDPDGWVVGFDGGHGLAPFLTAGGEVAHVGRDGRDLCRTAVDAPDGSAVLLCDAQGRPLWRGTAGPGTFAAEVPYLSGDPRAYADPSVYEGDPEPLVRQLLDAPARRFYPCSLIFDRREDAYDLEDLDAYDLECTENGALRVLAETWLAAERLAEYPFLEDNAQAGFARIHDAVEERLRARYGDPLPHAGHCLRSGDGNSSLTWEVEGRHLVLEQYCQNGDGDWDLQIWLAVVEA
ncbi:WG repeat-containing protein [Streptomyces sp. NPDC090077]|uniref:WG repeat-containing protein n=1 Tax=Streptomyces sp. NPDC090077 TaxID=3365938 RepID=UPI0037F4EF2D